MVTTTINSKGQIIIPVQLRKAHNIKKGERFSIEEKEDMLILRPLTSNYFHDMVGILKTNGKLTKSLVKQRQIDKKKEA